MYLDILPHPYCTTLILFMVLLLEFIVSKDTVYSIAREYAPVNPYFWKIMELFVI